VNPLCEPLTAWFTCRRQLGASPEQLSARARDTTQTVVRLGRDVEMGVRLAIWSLLAGCLLGVVSEPVLAASDTIDPHVVIQRMARAYDGIRDYTAVFLKRERIKGTLLPLE
jgi:hypothetical protein